MDDILYACQGSTNGRHLLFSGATMVTENLDDYEGSISCFVEGHIHMWRWSLGTSADSIMQMILAEIRDIHGDELADSEAEMVRDYVLRFYDFSDEE